MTTPKKSSKKDSKGRSGTFNVVEDADYMYGEEQATLLGPARRAPAPKMPDSERLAAKRADRGKNPVSRESERERRSSHFILLARQSSRAAQAHERAVAHAALLESHKLRVAARENRIDELLTRELPPAPAATVDAPPAAAHIIPIKARPATHDGACAAAHVIPVKVRAMRPTSHDLFPTLSERLEGPVQQFDVHRYVGSAGAFSFASSSPPRPSQINGAMGEATGTDDLDRPGGPGRGKGKGGKGGARSREWANARAGHVPLRRKGRAPVEGSPERKEEESELGEFKEDQESSVATRFVVKREQVRVKSEVPVRHNSGNLIGFHDAGLPVFAPPFGSDKAFGLSGKNALLRIDANPGVELHGYEEVVPGVYNPIEPPDEVYDLISFEAWLDDAPSVVTRRPWTMSQAPRVAFGAREGDEVSLEYSLEVQMLIDFCRKKAPSMNVKMDSIGSLTGAMGMAFPGLPMSMYLDTANRHLGELLRIRIAAEESVAVRVSRNLPEAPVQMVALSPAFQAHVFQRDFPVSCAYGGVPKVAHSDVHVSLALPGIGFDGRLVRNDDESDAEYAQRMTDAWDYAPEETTRFVPLGGHGYITLSDDLFEMSGVRHDGAVLFGRFQSPTPHDYPLGHNVNFVQLIPEGIGMPFTYANTPNVVCDAVNKRMFTANGGSARRERELMEKQMLLLIHIRELDEAAYETMIVFLGMANNHRELLRLLGDPVVRDRELRLVCGFVVPQSEYERRNFPPAEMSDYVRWDRLQDALVLEAIGRRAAAAAFLTRCREAHDRVFRRNWLMLAIPAATTIGFVAAMSNDGPRRYHAAATILAGGIVTTVLVAAASVFWTITLAAHQYDEVMTGTLDLHGYFTWLPQWWLNSYAYDQVCSFLVRAHAKLRLNLAMLAWLFRNQFPYAAATGPGVYTTGHAVDVQLKGKELGKQGKVGRVVGAIGTGTPNTQGYANLVKEVFCGETSNLYLRGILAFRVAPAYFRTVLKCPDKQFVDYADGADQFVAFSDDEVARMRYMGHQFIYNADAASADSTVGPALLFAMLGWLLTSIGGGYLGRAICADFIGKWRMRNPCKRGEFFDFTPRNGAMPSGTVHTTSLQNIFSLLAQAATNAVFAAHQDAHERLVKVMALSDGTFEFRRGRLEYFNAARYGASAQLLMPGSEDLDVTFERLVRCGAESVGRIVTVQVCPTMATSTFLKRFEGVTDRGVHVSALAIGALLRRWGVVCGDITHIMFGITEREFSRMTLAQKWARYARGVVAGYKHEPSHVIMDALRGAFPAGAPLVLAGDELYRHENMMSQADQSRLVLPTSLLVARYGGSEEEWGELAGELRHHQMGASIRSRLYRQVLAVDYGYPPP